MTVVHNILNGGSYEGQLKGEDDLVTSKGTFVKTNMLVAA